MKELVSLANLRGFSRTILGAVALSTDYEKLPKRVAVERTWLENHGLAVTVTSEAARASTRSTGYFVGLVSFLCLSQPRTDSFLL